MTTHDFKKLHTGTIVRWREGVRSPRPGELTDTGTVNIVGERRFAQWRDGQQTDGDDDWALKQVEAPEYNQQIPTDTESDIEQARRRA